MDNGTYKDPKKLMAYEGRDGAEVIKEAIERQKYKDKGGKISCGHDFWDKDVELGEVVFCNRCKQFFARIACLPWLTRNKYSFDKNAEYHYGTNHLEGKWFTPIEARVTD
jgi:hypothetical protein